MFMVGVLSVYVGEKKEERFNAVVAEDAQWPRRTIRAERKKKLSQETMRSTVPHRLTVSC
jgi:hypothetical protein